MTVTINLIEIDARFKPLLKKSAQSMTRFCAASSSAYKLFSHNVIRISFFQSKITQLLSVPEFLIFTHTIEGRKPKSTNGPSPSELFISGVTAKFLQSRDTRARYASVFPLPICPPVQPSTCLQKLLHLVY